VPRRRILIIEDEPLQLELFGDFLEGEGHAVTRADSGVAVLRALAAGGEWDCLWIDPGGLGIPGEHEVVRLIRTRCPRIIVIVVSGSYHIVDIARGLEADGHMMKPFHIQDVTDLMERVAIARQRL
jgi:CheY-like chemotaxis protein